MNSVGPFDNRGRVVKCLPTLDEAMQRIAGWEPTDDPSSLKNAVLDAFHAVKEELERVE